MRILHTADWHLNDRLGRIDRTADLRAGVERIAGLCRSEKVDVLLVAGDLFSELARPDALRETIQHWQSVFAEFLATGGTILALTGNHDNENFCQTLRHAMALAAPTPVTPGETVPPGRLYLAADPTFLTLPDRSGSFSVPFVLMPWPTPVHYLKGEENQRYSNPGERNEKLAAAFARELGQFQTNPKCSKNAVLAAHIHLHGSAIGTGMFRLAPTDDIIVAGEPFSQAFSYVALGHIHKPQALDGNKHVRYSGSLDRLDLGESNDRKEVVLFEIGPKGLLGDPALLPLPATPIYEIAVNEPETDLPRLKAEYPDAGQDLVNLHIRYTAGKDNLEEVLKELDRIFPRWYARDWIEASRVEGTLVIGEADRSQSFSETVRDYLTKELQNHADREAILQLAEELLGEEK